ncbi:MAG: cytochrome C oxidase subunit IV family protein [Lewinella sp.]
MASHVSYEDSKKAVWKGLGLLAAVTVVEVVLSLLKAQDWAKDLQWLFLLLAVLIIILSVYKAYFIIYEFMHMGYEVKGLALSVLLPTGLLLWGVIAFFYEGDAWKGNREEINKRNRMEAPVQSGDTGSVTPAEDDLIIG